jgi:tellurite resistance protein TerC
LFKEALNAFAGITVLELLAFLVPFLVAIWIDLRSHRAGQAITMKDAAIWSAIWVACAMAFATFI